MAHDHLTEHLQDPNNFKEFQRARLLVEVASLINEKMRKKGVTRKQLAELLEVSKGRISHYLGGQCNLTLRTVADVFTALDCTFTPFAEESEDAGVWEEIPAEMGFVSLASKSRRIWEVKDGGDGYQALQLAK